MKRGDFPGELKQWWRVDQEDNPFELNEFKRKRVEGHLRIQFLGKFMYQAQITLLFKCGEFILLKNRRKYEIHPVFEYRGRKYFTYDQVAELSALMNRPRMHWEDGNNQEPARLGPVFQDRECYGEYNSGHNFCINICTIRHKCITASIKKERS